MPVCPVCSERVSFFRRTATGNCRRVINLLPWVRNMESYLIEWLETTDADPESAEDVRTAVSRLGELREQGDAFMEQLHARIHEPYEPYDHEDVEVWIAMARKLIREYNR